MKTGQQQQRYRVLERLAAGGMAEVYLAESAGIEGFKKRVAIKRVLPHLSEKKRFIAMFLDEARLSANLTHSNVAQVFDIGVGEGSYFIVMEYVDGSDLKAIIEFCRKTRRMLPVEVIAYIAEKICDGLAYAHEARSADGHPLHVVHRDVSPANVLITKWGEVKIVDFGLAKATSQLEKSEPGIVKGKFGYLAPESTHGSEVDARVDIFAVGIILWEMLAGRRLFLGENDFQTIKHVQEAIVPPLAPINKDVPPELDRIIARALARDPDKRYQTARELGRALNTFLFKHGKPVSAPDVAELVHGTVAARRTADQATDSTLHKLIEAALLEFTSLHDTAQRSGSIPDDGKGALPRTPKEPLAGRVSHFEDIGKWAEEVDGSPLSGESRSSRSPGSRRVELKELPAESGAVPTAKATPLALGGAAESEPVPTTKATPLALATDSISEPVPTAKATPLALATEGISEPAPTAKETPLALNSADAGSAPAPTLKESPNAKGSAQADAKTTARSAGVKAPGEANEGKVPTTIEVFAPGGTQVKPADALSSAKAKALLLMAALILLVMSAYFGGLILR